MNYSQLKKQQPYRKDKDVFYDSVIVNYLNNDLCLYVDYFIDTNITIKDINTLKHKIVEALALPHMDIYKQTNRLIYDITDIMQRTLLLGFIGGIRRERNKRNGKRIEKQKIVRLN